MTVTVTPETFTYVFFDAAVIAALAGEVLATVGMGDRNLHIEVDETTPIARVTIAGGDPIVLKAESGAFEDTRKPRAFGPLQASLAIGRMVLRVRDRDDGSFADAPDDADLDLAQAAAWDTYSVARLKRLGMAVHDQRWRYNFRNRHGFSDDVDRAFDQIWAAPTLTWPTLSSISAAARRAAA